MPENTNQLALSVVIITLNEESHIARAIESVKWAREVIVYDSGSTDRTCEIAQKMGAHVNAGPWSGFGATKRHATALAKYDWILSLDADEEVSEELASEIQQQFLSLQPEAAYQISRLSNYLNQWIHHGGWYPDRQIRLFHRGYSNWDEAAIHEKVQSQKTLRLKNNLYHYVFKNIEHQVQTNNRYSSLQAAELYKNNKSFSWFHYFTKPYVKFIECYFLKLGFLDGWVGFLIARNAAYSVLLKWSKLKELQAQEVKS
jgi:glycosyltransferase involved in cell wall biosynthesis